MRKAGLERRLAIAFCRTLSATLSNSSTGSSSALRQVRAVELHVLVGVALLQPPPPTLRTALFGRRVGSAVELVQGALQALCDLRELAPQQPAQGWSVRLTAGFDRRAQGAQGLQQVLDVVGQARTGLVDGVHVRVATLLLLALLRLVVVAEQTRQQPDVQHQRRAGRPARVQRQAQRPQAHFGRVARDVPGDAALVERLPVDPAHPGQSRDVLGSGHDELVRIALLVGEIGQAVHPALEGHAHAHEVAVHQLADAGEAAARIPQPAQRRARCQRSPGAPGPVPARSRRGSTGG